MGLVTRFAPSPTGYLHRGHAFSALTAHESARQAGGRFLLRMEDLDEGRCRLEFDSAILDDLAWLGLDWDAPICRQSEYRSDYAAVLADLQRRSLVYRCFRTRAELASEAMSAPHGLPVPFTGAPLPPDQEAERLEHGDSFAWRLSLAAAREAVGGFDALTFTEEGRGPGGEFGLIPANSSLGGDVVLARKDGAAAYHLAVVVDDAGSGVSHVVRGEDLFEAAHVQRLLQALLGLPTPLYRHHPLLLREDGRRYAKRDQAETLREIRARGVSPAQLRAELGFA